MGVAAGLVVAVGSSEGDHRSVWFGDLIIIKNNSHSVLRRKQNYELTELYIISFRCDN